MIPVSGSDRAAAVNIQGGSVAHIRRHARHQPSSVLQEIYRLEQSSGNPRASVLEVVRRVLQARGSEVPE